VPCGLFAGAQLLRRGARVQLGRRGLRPGLPRGARAAARHRFRGFATSEHYILYRAIMELVTKFTRYTYEYEQQKAAHMAVCTHCPYTVNMARWGICLPVYSI
jgi:hypothetical protein